MQIERSRLPLIGATLYLGRQLKSIGKGAVSLYGDCYGQESPKREQYVDGTTRKVNCYSQKDLPILDQAIKAVMERNKQ